MCYVVVLVCFGICASNSLARKPSDLYIRAVRNDQKMLNGVSNDPVCVANRTVYRQKRGVKFKIIVQSALKSMKLEQALEVMFGFRVQKIEEIPNGGNTILQTLNQNKIFIKVNSIKKADQMMKGEFEGLNSIRKTNTVKVPVPVAVGIVNHNQSFLAMDFLKMNVIEPETSFELGKKLADMHLHNIKSAKPAIKQFGFHVSTACGFIPQDNTWTDDWITFITKRRLQHQIDLLSKTQPSTYKKSVIEDYWPALKDKIPKLFEGLDIWPALVHGDLWPGNVAQYLNEPVMFDPAAFYGHHEYDIASTTIFGRYPKEFYKAYYEKIPKVKGYEIREQLYHLFHYLNHWNHYGEEYELSTLNTFIQLSQLV